MCNKIPAFFCREDQNSGVAALFKKNPENPLVLKKGHKWIKNILLSLATKVRVGRSGE